MSRALLLALVLSVVTSLALAGQSTKEKEARGFVGSMAALVYGTAWPTATYESWQLERVERLDDGLALVVRLSGESSFGGELWLEMVFEFRGGQFYDLRVVKHNAILMAPFKTANAIAGLAADLAQEYASSKPDTPAPQRNAPAAAPPASRMLRFVSRCGHPIDLWVRFRGLDGRWITRGVWSLTANDTTFLATGGERLQLTSSVVYVYAEVPNANYTWSGERAVRYKGRSLPIRTDTLTTDDTESYQLLFPCGNFPQRVVTAPPPELPREKKAPPAAELVVSTDDDKRQSIVLRRSGTPVAMLDESFSAETEIRNLTLRSVGGTDVVVFDTQDESWAVRYWWNLTEDELFYSAVSTDGKRRDSPNFDGPAGSAGDWMRRTFLLPWLTRP